MNNEEQRILDMLRAKLAPMDEQLKANGGTPTPEMQENMELSQKNQSEVQELIDKKNARGDVMYEGTMGFKMDEEIFAKMQEYQCGFDGAIGFNKTAGKKLEEKLGMGKECELDFAESMTLIFMKTFGCYGQERDLETALKMASGYLNYILQQKPNANNTRQDGEYMGWLRAVGLLNILLGTVYTYKKEVVKACYYFMQGLKTEMVQMNTPYTDFIRSVLSKLGSMDKENDSREGIGYTPDNPSGSVGGGNMLNAQAALQIIPDIVSDDGDILVCHNGAISQYGFLERRGSTSAGAGMIDIYKTWLIDKSFNLKQIEIYWNGYFPMWGGGKVLLPVGFRIKKQSKHLSSYEFVKNKNAEAERLAEAAPY